MPAPEVSPNMRRSALIISALTLALVSTTLHAADSPSAEAPTFVAGDEWRFSDGAVLRVEAVEGDQVLTSFEFRGNRCPGCKHYRDHNFTVVKVVDKDGAAIADPYGSVGLKVLDFPLTVGKSWESHQTLARLGSGALEPYENTFKVDGYGDVKTKGGTFKAYKITWKQENVGKDRWSGRATLWYSPEARTIVKREVHTSNWLPDRELASYTVK
jgi:hypothetical protein